MIYEDLMQEFEPAINRLGIDNALGMPDHEVADRIVEFIRTMLDERFEHVMKDQGLNALDEAIQLRYKYGLQIRTMEEDIELAQNPPWYWRTESMQPPTDSQ